ncbi:hypothetical protein SynRS9902_02127 [Synechococcus sp. RS9902]|nr:hypothetical protein SynRS9902_02127 [Synechococcus sp. RS9902]
MTSIIALITGSTECIESLLRIPILARNRLQTMAKIEKSERVSAAQAAARPGFRAA